MSIKIECPECGSSNVKKSAVIYESGTRHSRGRAVGVGFSRRGLGVGAGSFSSQSASLLAEKNTPPNWGGSAVLTFLAAFGLILVISISLSIPLLTAFITACVFAVTAAVFVQIIVGPSETQAIRAYQNRWNCLRCGRQFTYNPDNRLRKTQSPGARARRQRKN